MRKATRGTKRRKTSLWDMSMSNARVWTMTLGENNWVE